MINNKYFYIIALLVAGSVGAMEKSLNDQLLEAAKQGNAEKVTQLLEAGANVQAKDKSGTTALHFVAEKGLIDVARKLLSAGIKVDVGDKDNTTPLHFAASENQADMVQFLLSKGADVNAKVDDGTTPLFAAVWLGDTDTEVAKILLAAGAEVNAQLPNGTTPLHSASVRNQIDMVRLLLANGADPTLQEVGALGPATPYQTAAMMPGVGGGDEVRRIIVDHVTATQSHEVRGILQFLIELQRRGQLPRDMRMMLRNQAVQDLINAKLAKARPAVPGYPEDELREEIRASVEEALRTTPIKPLPQTEELEDPFGTWLPQG